MNKKLKHSVALALFAMNIALPVHAEYVADQYSENNLRSAPLTTDLNYSTGMNSKTGKYTLGIAQNNASQLKTVTVGINATSGFLPNSKMVLLQNSIAEKIGTEVNPAYYTYTGKFQANGKTWTATAIYDPDKDKWTTSLLDEDGKPDKQMKIQSGPYVNTDIKLEVGAVNKKTNGYFMTNKITKTNQVSGKQTSQEATVQTGDVVTATVNAVGTSHANDDSLTVKVNGQTVATYTGVHYYSVNDGGSHAGNYNNTGATGANAIAAGPDAKAGGASSVAVGNTAKALADNAIAIGNGSNVSGENSIAIGTGHTVSGKNSGAFGDPSTISGDGSYAIGNDNTIEVNDGFILGNNASVTKAGGVALGTDSVADRDKDVSGYDPATKSESTKSDAAWKSTAAAVSVGADGTTRQITNVAAGSEDTDAVNVAQLKAARVEVKAGENIKVKESNNEDGSTIYTISTSGNSNVKVIKGKNTTVTEGKDGEFITYAVDVMSDGKVESGDTGLVTGDTVYNETRVKNDGNYIKKDNTAGENITALDEKVKDNSDRIDNINNQFTSLDSRMRKGLAGAAALAALHPMDFNPDDKLQFSAGVGNYRGETAAALGAFYRPDESVMFSVGGTFGNADNMVNAGITFGLDGARNRVTRSRTAMAKEIVELRSLVTQMAARMDRMEAANGIETTMFPDVPENHWAYEYVEDLQKRGALKGYPDGLFKGDRAMTRYEFAAMLDRIVRDGIRLDSKIAREFEPELGRIYVERISGEDNDRKKVERVRVNNSDSKYPEGKTRDVYGSKIVTAASEKATGE